MSFKNIHFDRRQCKIYLWDNTTSDNTKPRVIDWVPYVYVKSAEDTGVKSIYGNNVAKREFEYYRQYKDFCEAASDSYNPKNPIVFENNVKPEIQFLVDRYSHIPDDEIEAPKIHYSIIDIEVDTTKINETKLVKCRLDGHEDWYTLPQIKRLYKQPEVFNSQTEEWEPFSIGMFLSSYGFPEPHLAERPICVISVYNSKINKIFTFGLKEYTGDSGNNEWWRYIKCSNELDLIDKFTYFMHRTCPDIISGWNSNRFDLPYIINRIRVLLPDNSKKAENASMYGMQAATSKAALSYINRLSPIGEVSFWQKQSVSAVTKAIEIETKINIAGVSILDYMLLYKAYSNSRLESNRLDVVATHELDKGKLSYEEFNNLTELYNFNYNKYVDYNIIDVKRVKQIQEKLGYFELIQALSLLTKAPMESYDAVTHLSEAAFLTYYRRNGLCAPFAPRGVKVDFVAAYVKQPLPGFYRWLCDLDISSSYPAQMILMNMGLETFIGTIKMLITENGPVKPTEEDIVKCIRKREFSPFILLDKFEDESSVCYSDLDDFNEKLKAGLYTISPNGVIFRTDIKGAIAEVERYLFYKRVDVRNKQKAVGKLRDKVANKDSDEYMELDNKLMQYQNLQMAIKLILNGTYGALSAPYFRMFNPYIPTAITAGGRHSIRNGEKFTNDLLNNISLSPKLLAAVNELKTRKPI